MEEIKNLEEAKEHLNKLLALLKKNPIQEETKNFCPVHRVKYFIE